MNNRQDWIDLLTKIVTPVLIEAEKHELKKNMPVETNGVGREKFSHIEAIGRSLCGIAPWIENDPQAQEYARLARCAIADITDPTSNDYVKIEADGTDSQILVDIAFLSQAILRAENELYNKLTDKEKANLTAYLIDTRKIPPSENNWLLFSGTIEALLHKIGKQADLMRVDYAVKQHMQRYKGEGIYGDGDEFKWDYYNSYVISPMLMDIVEVFKDRYEKYYDTIQNNAKRYGEILEGLINADGSFPAVGRSITYRSGAFHLLSQLTYEEKLAKSLTYGGVRCALSAMINKCFEKEDTFDKDGWLTVGLHGHQPHMGERYISTGSLYLCLFAFLPLGLPESHPFWTEKDEPWSAVKIWAN
ncbi:MAG: DUF2264 domain-containing protein [Eubacteriales bacterium]|nr:DUF2264 domain-containing protein [Eubacteriales bacterium]